MSDLKESYPEVMLPSPEKLNLDPPPSPSRGRSFADVIGTGVGCVGCLVFLGYTSFQILAAFVGIDHYWGKGWAIGLIILAFATRISFHLVVFSFLGAWKVWGWHWFLALSFSAPMLVISVAMLVPGIFAILSDWLRNRRSR